MLDPPVEKDLGFDHLTLLVTHLSCVSAFQFSQTPSDPTLLSFATEFGGEVSENGARMQRLRYLVTLFLLFVFAFSSFGIAVFDITRTAVSTLRPQESYGLDLQTSLGGPIASGSQEGMGCIH